MSHSNEHDHGHHDHHGHDHDGGHGHLTHLAIVVNGEPTLVEVDEHAPLGIVIPKALEQTHNVGQPPENWELHDAAGHVLDLSRAIKDYHFPKDVKLRLTLKAGVGG